MTKAANKAASRLFGSTSSGSARGSSPAAPQEQQQRAQQPSELTPEWS